jgi:hypothetical protein
MTMGEVQTLERKAQGEFEGLMVTNLLEPNAGLCAPNYFTA